MDQVAKDIAASLETRHKASGAVIKNRNTRYSEDDPELWKEMKQGADGYIYIGAASSSTTSYVFKWSTHLEQIGLPGGAAYFDQLESVRETTQAREGAQIRGAAFSYPVDAMDRTRYANAIEQTIATLTAALTTTERATGPIAHSLRPTSQMNSGSRPLFAAYHSRGPSTSAARPSRP